MKFLYLLFLLFSLYSCSQSSGDFEGVWIDKEYENYIITIEKQNGNYLVTIDDSKYPAEIKNNLLEINMTNPLKAMIGDSNTLIINGKEYLNFDNAMKYKYLGLWDMDGFVIEITEGNKNRMYITCVEGSQAKEMDRVEFYYREGHIEFYDPLFKRYNYYILEKDGRLKITYNDTQSDYLEKLEAN